MTTVVAALFSLAIVIAVDQAEIDLASESMHRQLAFIRSAMAQGVTPYLGPETRYFESGPNGYHAWPEWLNTLEDGFHEVRRDSGEVHVLIRAEGTVRHALVATLEEFEKRERMFQRTTAVGFVASALAALALGFIMARRVISPVVRLSRQVQHRDQLLPLAPPLAPDYADDEVGRLAEAFDHTLGRLREAIERERMFTSDVSHELRTPLMVIASSCELMLAQGVEDQRKRAHIGRIQRACGEMLELADTILRLARSPKTAEDGAEALLGDIAEEQVRNWHDDAVRRGLDLQLVVESDDRGRYSTPMLRAVLSNLLRNALHYTDHGFVRVIVHTGGFRVVDSGVGIPETDRERMFAPFTRGDESRGDGSGIGLSLVQRICARQGWQISLAERQGGGCEFRVDLSRS